MSFKLLLGSLFSWALFSFISNSLLAVHHVLILLAFITATVFERKKLKYDSSVVALLVFFLILNLSVIVNWSELASPFSKASKTKYFLFAAMGYLLVKFYKEKLVVYLPKLSATFLLSFLTSGFYGVGRYLYSIIVHNDFSYRATGFFGMVMSYSYTSVLPILAILFLCLNPKLRLNVANGPFKVFDYANVRWVVCLFSFVVLWFTQARGALLGFLFSFPILLLKGNKRLFVRWIVVVVLFVSGIVGISAVSNIGSGNSPLRIFQSLNSENSRLRLSQYQLGWNAFLEKPLLGQGWRSLEERSAELKKRHNLEFTEFAGHAHNNFLEILGTSGFLGFLAFCFWIFLWLRDLFRTKNLSPAAFLYFSILMAFFVSGLVQSTVIDSEFMFSFLALYALSPLVYSSNRETLHK